MHLFTNQYHQQYGGDSIIFGFITVSRREGSLADLVAANRRRSIVKEHTHTYWLYDTHSSRISQRTSLNFNIHAAQREGAMIARLERLSKTLDRKRILGEKISVWKIYALDIWQPSRKDSGG